jgi:hypothetical protein
MADVRDISIWTGMVTGLVRVEGAVVEQVTKVAEAVQAV